MLAHGQLEVEPVSRFVRIGQCAPDQWARVYPTVEFRPPQQHIVELGIVIVNAPFGQSIGPV